MVTHPHRALTTLAAADGGRLPARAGSWVPTRLCEAVLMFPIFIHTEIKLRLVKNKPLPKSQSY